MANAQLEVFYPDGTNYSYELGAEKLVVGTATRCDVVIDRPEFAPQHLQVMPRPDGCYVAVARGVATPSLYNGNAFERELIPWGGTIYIGAVRLLFNDAARSKKKQDEEKGQKNEGVSPVLLIAAAVIVPIALYQSFATPAVTAPSRVRTPPPALFESLQRPCPQNDPNLLQAAAEENARVALAKAERMPFRTQDGIEAVAYYAQSSSCYRAAGNARAADVAMRQATNLQVRLEDDYRAHQFRMERALEQSRTEDALYETRMLMALVHHRRRDPYYAALQNLERQLTLRMDQAAAAAR